MKTADLDFSFPEELVATRPPQERDASRLMLVERKSSVISHFSVRDLPRLLRKGDLLILNNTKVIPARLYAERESGGKHEVLLTKKAGDGDFPRIWHAIISNAKKIKRGTKLSFCSAIKAVCVDRSPSGVTIEFNAEGDRLKSFIYEHGRLPLPPYIGRNADEFDWERYQTVYASKPTSSAAPTAGLHLSNVLLKELSRHGIDIAFVTLDISYDTFLPVREENIENHTIHGERISVPTETAGKINEAKSNGRRVIAIGTTSVRAVESSYKNGRCVAVDEETRLFITPGYKFNLIDGILTNFHRPCSTLLALVAAFAGYSLTMSAYKEAVEKRYKLFSYGDAMLIL